MPEKLLRYSETYGPVTLTNNPATSFRIPMSLSGGAIVQITACSANDTIKWYSCASSQPDARTFQYFDKTGAAVTAVQVNADRCYEVPADMFPAVYVIPVTTTGNATAFVTVKG